jgi:peptidoglycan L-alanyl-D-glutamate endopeptidase CwlK
MFLFSMLLLFAAACAAGCLVLFPSARDALGARIGRFNSGAGRSCRGLLAEAALTAGAARRGLRTTARLAVRAGRRHPALMTGCAMLVLVPPLAALVLGSDLRLPGSQAAADRAVNAQVALLLRGERLAAPVMPPPAVFTTAEVSVARPQLTGANRNWDFLDAGFTQRLLLVFKVMREQYGYEMVLLEGYRSPGRQNQLADAGSHVTNARAFQSYHQFGLAGDCAFLRDGKVVITEKDPWAMRGYQLYGKVAEAAGLTWGGRWKMMDFGHVEQRLRRR